MNNAMLDQKPRVNPGYTGRHDDKPEKLSREQVGILSFVAGMIFAITLSLMWSSV